MEGPRRGPFFVTRPAPRHAHVEPLAADHTTGARRLDCRPRCAVGHRGGWALELWAGESWREHSDIEITCFREDLPDVLPAVARFEIAVARNKVLTPFRPGDALPDPPYSLWLRRHPETLWDFEIVAEARDQRRVGYRRAPADFRASGCNSLCGKRGRTSYHRAPRSSFCFKTKEPRPRDLEDLRVRIPRLDRARPGTGFARPLLRRTPSSSRPSTVSRGHATARAAYGSDSASLLPWRAPDFAAMFVATQITCRAPLPPWARAFTSSTACPIAAGAW